MKTLITVLFITSFIQNTFLPIDLVLIILISRSYIKSSRSNLILAFTFGLLVGFLNLQTLGVTSLIYLILVQITESLSKSRLAGNAFIIIPLTFALLSINNVVTSFFIHESLELFPKVSFESLLALPIFYLVRLWEERFIVRREIKLRF